MSGFRAPAPSGAIARRGVTLYKTADEVWVASGADTDFGPWTEDVDTDGFFPFDVGGVQTVRIPVGLDGIYLQSHLASVSGGGAVTSNIFTGLAQRDLSAAYSRYNARAGGRYAHLVSGLRAAGEDLSGTASMSNSGAVPGSIAKGNLPSHPTDPDVGTILAFLRIAGTV